nr:uncharacterized protein LOC106686686 [Halyomorpha halys]
MLVLALSLGLLQLVAHGDAAACIPYQSSCTLLNAITCCGFPLTTLCLPDSRGGTSCLSPLDVQNLAPGLTSLNPIAPLIGGLEGGVRTVLNPSSDPLVNPILNPLVNPILDPLANPILDPLANPTFNPLLNTPPSSG